MTSEKAGLSIRDARIKRNEEFCVALNLFSSNVYSLLVTQAADTRFLRINYREDGTWLLIAGSYDEVGEPIVCFGNGISFCNALYNLGRAMANDEWREDKLAGKA